MDVRSSINNHEQEPDSEALSSALLMLSRTNNVVLGKSMQSPPHHSLSSAASHSHSQYGQYVDTLPAHGQSTTSAMNYQDQQEDLLVAAHHITATSSSSARQSRQQHYDPHQSATISQSPLSPHTTQPPRIEGGNEPLSKTVTLADLRKYFHLPIAEVARQMGTCTTAMKKICRKNGVSKWPHRQIRSITKSIQSLEMASLNDTLSEDLRIHYRNQIVALQNTIDELIQDPNKTISLVNIGFTEDADPLNAPPERESLDDVHTCYDPNSSSLMTTDPSPSAAMRNTQVPKYLEGKLLTEDGVLNLAAWPKPSAVVQQIMQAAAEEHTMSLDKGKNNVTTTLQNRSKRKFSSSHRAVAEGSRAAKSIPHGVTQRLPSSVHDFNGSTHGKGSSNGVDLSPLDNTLMNRKIEIGDTVVACNFNPESQRLLFSGPVQLAPLQRKKLRPNVTRKVVPLMEPDIGSNFGMEFVPQFILRSLNESLNEHKARADLDNRHRADTRMIPSHDNYTAGVSLNYHNYYNSGNGGQVSNLSSDRHMENQFAGSTAMPSAAHRMHS